MAAAARQAGIAIALQQASYEQVFNDYNNALTPSNHDKWAMTDTGPSTQYLYPTANTAFDTGGIFNSSSQRSEADRLISASIHGTNPDAVTTRPHTSRSSSPACSSRSPVWSTPGRRSCPGRRTRCRASLTQFYLTPEAWYYTR